jgi:hypothetical protein
MAAYQSREHELCREVEDAREHVKHAHMAYSRGGSVDEVNRANQRLADAHAAWRDHRAGRIPEHPGRE